MAHFGHDMCVDCSISYLLAQIMTLRLLKRGTSMAPLANSSEPWTPGSSLRPLAACKLGLGNGFGIAFTAIEI